MKYRLVVDGNAVYEIDEECIRQKEEEERKKTYEANRRNTPARHRRRRPFLMPADGKKKAGEKIPGFLFTVL